MTLISDGVDDGAIWRMRDDKNAFTVSLEGLFGGSLGDSCIRGGR